ncbi:nuclear pore complex protein Nup214 [Diachasma alloeum]|uniref:nuclear pore complex protein Nup214 n=1 Tax=Diachasma alloeum TaxID=454923 RepID=UPI000738147E|nr:nuclear pore complex protein Nup214 [Diachasma alloeum]
MNNMWKLDNPGVIVLVSVLSGCVILYTSSGALIGILLALIITVYGCVSLLIDDSLVTRHASIVQDYLSAAGVNFNELFDIISSQTSGYVSQLFEIVKECYKEQITNRMERYRRSTYQLSSESLVNSPRTAGQLKTLKGLSPIPKRSVGAHISESENNVYVGRSSGAYESARAFDKVTSTPVIPWKRRDAKNGDVCGDSIVGHRHVKKSSSDLGCGGNREEEGSPWGTSISPKIRPRAAGVKTVQTVAGPLLASTRYNIDTKTYTDITSPGLTSRLTKYATEATTKLRQSPYGTGQFPKVNLSSSPTPLINSKTGKMRLPVTVRIAPPDTRYSPPERQRMISDICQDPPRTPPTVAQVLRDMSLKRHASREDVAAELIKKQRTDGLYGDELENLEEMTQKRAREDSSRSDEDISIDNTSLRPVKRTKKPSCYDILNSLSSSTNVNSGVKRKADISRSGTPDLGKHFKSLDTSQVSRSSKLPGDLQNSNKSINESSLSLPDAASRRSSPESVSPRSPGRPSSKHASPEAHEIEEIFKNTKNSMIEVPVKLTDRLFMKEEPQNIDKLKSLIDEHSSLSSKFSMSDVEEIKKSDIINMRQTSMKAKLKSMFDAISGKTSSTIDPSVVIQAESITLPSSPSSLATLSSSTCTTNVNTSPISTSAIVPIIGKAKTMGTPGKHVTFNLASGSGSSSSLSSGVVLPQLELDKPEGKEEINKPEASAGFSFASSVVTSPSSSAGDKSQGFSITQAPTSSAPVSNPTTTANSTAPAVTSSSQTPTFSFGTSSTSASTAQTIPTFSQSSQKLFQPATAVSTAVTTSAVDAAPKATTLFSTPTSTTSSSGTPAPPAPGNGLLTFVGASKSPPKVAGFSFGAVSSSSSGASQTATTSTSSSGSGFNFGVGSGAATSTPVFGATTTSAPATSTQSSTFTFGGNKTTQSTTPSSGFSFGSTAPVASFGGSTTSQAPATTTLTFGTATSASTLAFGSSTTAAPAFGTPSATASTPAFGSSSTTSTFGTPSTAAPAFGNPSTTTALGTTSTASGFGTPSTTASAFGTPSTTAPAFGAPSTAAPAFATPSTPSFSSAPTPLFGTQPSGFNSTTTTATAITFGPPKTTVSAFGTTTASTTPSLFNGATTTPSTSNSMFSGASAFAQGKPPTFGATTTAATGFGGTTSTSFGGPSSLFGGQPTTTAGFGGNPSTTTTSAFGQTSSGFGGNTTAAPAFGTSSVVPSFGGTSSGFGGQNSGASSSFSGTAAFGATTTAPPAFPTGTSSTSGFGGSSSSFGTPTTAPPAFGSANSSFSGFGGSTPGSGAASPFGGAAPAFGTTGSGSTGTVAPFGGTNASGGFSFGGSGTTPATTQGTQGMFSFGGGSSSSGFQFNGSAAPQTGGFNFSGSATPASSSVPSFSAPVPSFGASSGGNMFSIGSGSVAPRSRSTRPGRRQR